MEGIEILSTFQYACDVELNKPVCLFVFLLFFIFLIISFYIFEKVDIQNIAISIIVSIFSALLLGALYASPCNFEERYKVLISDEVKLKEFLQKYEIISVEGQIYTIREVDINE